MLKDRMRIDRMRIDRMWKDRMLIDITWCEIFHIFMDELHKRELKMYGKL